MGKYSEGGGMIIDFPFGFLPSFFSTANTEHSQDNRTRIKFVQKNGLLESFSD